MPVRKSSENTLGKILEGLPSAATRHLIILQCGKYALAEAAKAEDANQPEAASGANDAAMAVLLQLGEDPVELKRFGRLEGVRLKTSLFKPLKGLDLGPREQMVYQAALDTAEVQMRRLYDSNYRYPEVFCA